MAIDKKVGKQDDEAYNTRNITGSEEKKDLKYRQFRNIYMFTKTGKSDYSQFRRDQDQKEVRKRSEMTPMELAIDRIENIRGHLNSKGGETQSDSVESVEEKKNSALEKSNLEKKTRKKRKFVSEHLNANHGLIENYRKLINNGNINLNNGEIDHERLKELWQRAKLTSDEIKKRWELGQRRDRAWRLEHEERVRAELKGQERLKDLLQKSDKPESGEFAKLDAELKQLDAVLTRLTPDEIKEKQDLESAYIGSIRYNRQLVGHLEMQMQDIQTNLETIASKFEKSLKEPGDRQSVLMEVCDGEDPKKSDSDLKKLHRAMAESLNANGWLYAGVRNALAKELKKVDPKLDMAGATEAANLLVPSGLYVKNGVAMGKLAACLDKGFPRKYGDTVEQAYIERRWQATKYQHDREGTQNIAEIYKEVRSISQELIKQWNSLLDRLTPNENGSATS